MKTCPVPGCGALIRAQVRICGQCWRRLPYEIRDDLSTFPPGTPDYQEALREALAYLADRAQRTQLRRTG